MKFTILAFIVGLCLAVVTANVEPIDNYDIEFLSQNPNDDFVDIEPYGAFTGIYWVCKGALKTLKRMNCAIQAAVKMQVAAQKYIDDVQNCGGLISKPVQAVITSCKNVIVDVSSIINVSTTICNNPDYTEDTNSTQKTGWNCFWKILKQFLKLKNDIQKTLQAIKKLPSTGPDANDCMKTAAQQLADTFNNFPSFMKICSKLTSN